MVYLKYSFIILTILFLNGCSISKQDAVVQKDPNYIYTSCEIKNDYGLIGCGQIPISVKKEINAKFLPYCDINFEKFRQSDKSCLEKNKSRVADAYTLGNLIYYGEYFVKNESEGLELINFAAKNKYPQAILWLSKKYESEGELEISTQLLQEAATLGSPLAMHSLGFRLHRGIGLDRNDDKALSLFDQSKKFIPASYSEIAGINFSMGNIQAYIDNNHIAFEKGYLFALADLGFFYLGEIKNTEMYRDLDKVDDFSSKLIGYDIAVGYALRAKLLQLRYVGERNNEICKLYKISYEKGYLDAGLGLGAEYLTGANCEKNYEDALNIFVNLFESKNIEMKKLAASNLGYIYINGLGIPANVEKAKQYLEYSANLGFQPAIDMLNNIN